MRRILIGATSSFTFGGRYERGSGSVVFYPDGSLASFATVTEKGLVERWEGGMTFVFSKILEHPTAIASNPAAFRRLTDSKTCHIM